MKRFIAVALARVPTTLQLDSGGGDLYDSVSNVSSRGKAVARSVAFPGAGVAFVATIIELISEGIGFLFI